MDATHFDRIAMRFAARRLSRRQAVLLGGAGLGAAISSGLAGTAHAQEATPPAVGTTGEKVEYLFVQSFRSGTVEPKAGEDGTYTLTLADGLGQTIAFSDRPERIVGAAPTPQFLTGLGFPPGNPPNAALVVETASGDTEIAVVELTNPTYETTTHTATYDVQVLAEWEDELGIGLTKTPADLAAFGNSFGAAHLFIDDCSDGTVTCGNAGSFRTGFCSDPTNFWCCKPCVNGGAYDWDYTAEVYQEECAQRFPDQCSQGNCDLSFHEDDPSWACG